MQRYLLNEKTGVISLEGTSTEDVIVRAVEVEFDGGFRLEGTKADGTEFTATLTVEQYFEGKEFVIDAVEVKAEEVTTEVVAPVSAKELITHVSCLDMDEVSLDGALKRFKIDMDTYIRMYNSAKNKVKRDEAITKLNELAVKVDKRAVKLAERLSGYRATNEPTQNKLNELFDKVNELHDMEYDINKAIKDLQRIQLTGADKYTYELVFNNID